MVGEELFADYGRWYWLSLNPIRLSFGALQTLRELSRVPSIESFVEEEDSELFCQDADWLISYQQIQINLGISKNEITHLNLLGMLSSVHRCCTSSAAIVQNVRSISRNESVVKIRGRSSCRFSISVYLSVCLSAFYGGLSTYLSHVYTFISSTISSSTYHLSVHPFRI